MSGSRDLANDIVQTIRMKIPFLVSSPEPKAQVSFSDHILSVVRPSARLSVCPSVCLSVRPSVNFYIFDFFSRNTGPILTKLGTNHHWGVGILNCSNEGDVHLQGEIIAKE
jgi:hypothetical protein